MSLNPQSVNLEIGIRELKSKTLYPLSYGQQLKVSKQITSILATLAKDTMAMSELEFAQKIMGIILDILPSIITDCSDITEDEFMEEVTNNQIAEIIQHIYQMNYEVLAKNAQSLLLKFQEATGKVASTMTANSSVTSLNDTQASPSKKSTTKDFKKEG